MDTKIHIEFPTINFSNNLNNNFRKEMIFESFSYIWITIKGCYECILLIEFFVIDETWNEWSYIEWSCHLLSIWTFSMRNVYSAYQNYSKLVQITWRMFVMEPFNCENFSIFISSFQKMNIFIENVEWETEQSMNIFKTQIHTCPK